MKNFNRIISFVVLLAFSLSNISFASELNSFKLATPSNFSNFKGPEFKDAAQIQAGIREALKGMSSFDLESLRSLGIREFTEKSVFGKKVQALIHFPTAQKCRIEGAQIQTEEGSYVFKANTRLGVNYYCLVSKDASATYKISVVPERVLNEAIRKGVVKFTHESVDKKDKDIIELYLEHEISTENNTAIDEFIRKKMEAGEYGVTDYFMKNLLYRSTKYTFSYKNLYAKAVDELMDRLRGFGVAAQNVKKIGEELLSKPLVLIPYGGEPDKLDIPV